MKYTDFHEQHFRSSVTKALKRVETILDTTRNPRLAEEEEYNDKYALTEFLTNTAVAAQMNALEQLGLTPELLQTIYGWVHDDKQTATLRFRAQDTCTFLKEEQVDVHQIGTNTTTTTTHSGGIFGGLSGNGREKTKKTSVTTHVKEFHFKVTVSYSIVLFPGSDPESGVVLQTRDASTIVVSSGANSTVSWGTNDHPAPIPEITMHPPVDTNLAWFFRMISPEKQICQFHIDRGTKEAQETCKTPRRNKDVDAAVEFNQNLDDWARSTQEFFLCRVEKEIMGKHRPANTGSATDGCGLSSITPDQIFCPIVPLMEDHSILSTADVGAFLSEQSRSIDEATEHLFKIYPPHQLVELISIAEATIVLMCQHLMLLKLAYHGSIDYVEGMLEKQLIQAIGKEIDANDFDQFMRFHNRQLFGNKYAPKPFSYAIRRPEHYPDGVLTIEGTLEKNEPVMTMVRKIDGTEAPSIYVPINAVASIEITGDRYLHGWLQHRFPADEQRYQLVARARQFSSFLVIVGTMAGADTFDPKNAIILQNKDEVIIPLLMNVLPTAKEFKDAVVSLSPEQKAFAESFRAMQLESSVFGVYVIQLKPQLERLLELPEGSLTKEIQLTQDLMSLFVEYQIPSDLLSYDGVVDTDIPSKVSKVKDYVKSVMDVIESSKEKQLFEEERKADMRDNLYLQEACAIPACMSVDVPRTPGAFRVVGGRPLRGGGHVQTRMPVFRSAMAVEDSGPPREKKASSMADALNWPGLNETDADMVMDDASASSFFAPGPHQRANETQNAMLQASGSKATGLDDSPVASGKRPRGSANDFTLIPKLLDKKLEKYDPSNALRSTIIKTGPGWTRMRQDNLLTPIKSSELSPSDIETEKKKAFDLLDAISRSGTLPIACAELHIVVAVSHCFENDLMETIIQDNINPIEKLERSALVIASTIYCEPPQKLLEEEHDLERLTGTFPLLFATGENE